MPSAPLSIIIAYARSGALDHAWSLFVAEEYDRLTEDTVALCVKGRLLKDLSARNAGGERRRLCREAAQSYERAATLKPASYPLINAATPIITFRKTLSAGIPCI